MINSTLEEASFYRDYVKFFSNQPFPAELNWISVWWALKAFHWFFRVMWIIERYLFVKSCWRAFSCSLEICNRDGHVKLEPTFLPTVDILVIKKQTQYEWLNRQLRIKANKPNFFGNCIFYRHFNGDILYRYTLHLLIDLKKNLNIKFKIRNTRNIDREISSFFYFLGIGKYLLKRIPIGNFPILN